MEVIKVVFEKCEGLKEKFLGIKKFYNCVLI